MGSTEGQQFGNCKLGYIDKVENRYEDVSRWASIAWHSDVSFGELWEIRNRDNAEITSCRAGSS